MTAFDLVDGQITPICTPSSGSLLPVGTKSVDCSASDAHRNTSTASFAVHVKGAGEQLSDLRASISSGPGNSLLAKVDSAIASVNAGNTNGTCGKLTALANEANARSGKDMLAAAADRLIAAARRIELAVGCKQVN